ncbi:MAG: zinc ribbon domain-containing protein [Acidobacteriia bacterium]|nr:zinc ribbon domain-containing protein [Terriglobia bacterium]
MPQYEFFCHACNRPFSKTLAPTELKESKVVCPRCGSEEVAQRWFYPVTARQSALAIRHVPTGFCGALFIAGIVPTDALGG